MSQNCLCLVIVASAAGASESEGDSPLHVYEKRVASGEFHRDSHQILIVEELQKLHSKLSTYQPQPVKEPGFMMKVESGLLSEKNIVSGGELLDIAGVQCRCRCNCAEHENK